LIIIFTHEYIVNIAARRLCRSCYNSAMKIIVATPDRFVLSLAPEEELNETLLTFCKEKNIAGATLDGLGATDKTELAYYNLSTKSYERHHIDERLEILSLTGNIGTLKGEKVLHAHGVFGRKDLSVLGGHIFSLRVSGACEIHLSALPQTLNRAHDDATGLNLLCT